MCDSTTLLKYYMEHTHLGPGSSRGVAAFPGTQQFGLHRCIAPMNSTGSEGFLQGGGGDHHGSGGQHDGGQLDGDGQGAHILREAASNIVLSEHDYVMADIKKEVIDWDEDGKQEELHENNEEDGEEEEDIEDYDEEEEEEDVEQDKRERWFNLSQLAEV